MTSDTFLESVLLAKNTQNIFKMLFIFLVPKQTKLRTAVLQKLRCKGIPGASGPGRSGQVSLEWNSQSTEWRARTFQNNGFCSLDRDARPSVQHGGFRNAINSQSLSSPLTPTTDEWHPGYRSNLVFENNHSSSLVCLAWSTRLLRQFLTRSGCRHAGDSSLELSNE